MNTDGRESKRTEKPTQEYWLYLQVLSTASGFISKSNYYFNQALFVPVQPIGIDFQDLIKILRKIDF